MNHRTSKRKFGYGIDSNQMLLRKLVTNFVTQGKIVTTQQKAQFMRPSVDRLVTHAKKDSLASMNILKSFFGVDEVAVNLKQAVKAAFSDRNSGFTRAIKMGTRPSDNAMMVQITWVSPVQYTSEKSKEKSEKPQLKVKKTLEAKSGKKVSVKPKTTVKKTI